MIRPSKEKTLMEVALSFSRQSTCIKAHVGAVLAKEGRIITTGFNGAPKGLPHCDEVGCDLDNNGACIRTVHAEANVVAFAAKYGIPTAGATLYTTIAPCYACAKLLVNAGVTRVVYLKEYRIKAGLELLAHGGVSVSHFGEK